MESLQNGLQSHSGVAPLWSIIRLCRKRYRSLDTTMTQTVVINRPLRPVGTKRQRYRQHKRCCVGGQMGMQPILPITVPVKKIRGNATLYRSVWTGLYGWKDRQQNHLLCSFRRRLLTSSSRLLVKQLCQHGILHLLLSSSFFFLLSCFLRPSTSLHK